MKAYTVYEVSRFSKLTQTTIRQRAKELGILPNLRTLTGQLVYNFSICDVGRILLYLDLKLPEKIIQIIEYNNYTSKMNNETDKSTITKNT